jgi:O-antigen/teichoic acid export membrane protein
MTEETSPAPARGLARVAMVNAAIQVVAQISNILIGMVLTPYVLHRLGRDLYGVTVAAGSAYEYMSVMRGGMAAAMRRYVTLHHHGGQPLEAKRYYAVGFWWSGLFRSVILLVSLLLAGPLSRFLRIPANAIIDGSIGVALILTAAVVSDTATTFGVPIYATGRTSRISTVHMGSIWLRLALVLLAFHLFVPNLRVYGSAILLTALLPVFVYAWMAWRTGVVGFPVPKPDFGDAEHRRHLFRYGGFALLWQIAGLLYVSTDNLLIGRIYGAGAITRYSLGTRWYPLIMGFLQGSVLSLTPIFTGMEARGESDRSRDALRRVVAVTSGLAVPFCLVPCVVGDLFLVHWVGPEYRSSAKYMIAMLVPLLLEASLMPVWMALLARGRIGWIAVGDIVVAVGNVGISLVLALVFKLGLLGFALGNTLALLAKNLLLRPIAARRDPSFPPTSEFLRSLPKALLGGAPALLLLYFLRGVIDASLATVVVGGTVGGALCLAGSLLSSVGWRQLRLLMRTALGQRKTTA